MAVNQSRSMSADFLQGSSDSTFISLIPDRGGVLASVPSERMAWPQYGQAQQHAKAPFVCDHSCHAGKPVEYTR